MEDHTLYVINERTLTLDRIKDLNTLLRDRKVQDFEVDQSSLIMTTDN